MCVILPNSIFVHFPKTGGTWVGEVLTKLGLAQLCGPHHPPTASIRSLVDRPHAFAFVRNPVTWYQSRWSSPGHRRHHKVWQRMTVGFARPAELEDFNLWLEAVLERSPGYVTHLYKKHLGPEFELVDFVGRYESLRPDLVEALEVCGEQFDPQVIHGWPAANTPEVDKSRRRYRPDLLEKIIRSDEAVMRRFGYNTDPADYAALLL